MTAKKSPKKGTKKTKTGTGSLVINDKKMTQVSKKITKTINVSTELSKIGDAYTEALSGKLKFSEVKEMFRKLHKEMKKSKK